MSDLEGRRPEEEKMTPEEQEIFDKIMREQGPPLQRKPDDEQIDLHDSEVMASAELMTELMAKYSYRPATYENLISLKSEAEERFEKIGLKVVVDISPVLGGEPPLIEIVERVAAFDHQRQEAEVRRGVADPFYDALKGRK